MNTRRKTRAVGGVAFASVLWLTSCGSGDSLGASTTISPGPDPSVAEPDVSTSVTTPTDNSTTESSTTQSVEPAADPAVEASTRIIGAELTEGSWPDAEHVGRVESWAIAGVLPGSRKVVHFERTGETVEGCEGGRDPLSRLVLTDFSTGQRSILVENLEPTDIGIDLGPQGRVALIGGCDANGWLAAVGTIDAGGFLELPRLDHSADDAVRFGGNDGYSTTWSADGNVLYLGPLEIDVSTGMPLKEYDFQAPLRLHGKLADGSRLVSGPPDAQSQSAFWLLDPDEGYDHLPQTAPIMAGRALYPSADVSLAADGERILIVLDQWTNDERTMIVGGGEVVEIAGFAQLSPDGTRLLVRSGFDPVSLSIVDLVSGQGTVIPMPDDGQLMEVRWAGGSETALIATAPTNLGFNTTMDIWFLDLT